LGEKLPEAPEGSPVTERLTAEAKPFTLPIVAV
jgi:hypothetical protein